MAQLHHSARVPRRRRCVSEVGVGDDELGVDLSRVEHDEFGRVVGVVDATLVHRPVAANTQQHPE